MLIKKQKLSLSLTLLYVFVNFRNNMLVHHQFIQSNKVHVKIGGDHGGGSFKMSYQIANVHNPNSANNTIVFSIFEAKDYCSNIEIALTDFKNK